MQKKLLIANKYVFIQVRTSSKRLFGKCLFKIKGKEAILVLFNRIKSKSYKTIILTSNDKSDDYLVKILKKNSIPYFRGDLNNVRDRFLKCSKSFNNDDIIVRCTADNLFIDKFFIKDLLKKFIKNKKDYIAIDRKRSKLPYGLAAEVFNVKALRKFTITKQSDAEHVTPAILRNSRSIQMVKIENDKNYYHLSCTIDEISDYFKIKYIFENHSNKILTSWKKLCLDLNKINKKSIDIIVKKQFNKIALGTAQLGSRYGINNTSKNNSKEKINILKYAVSIGISDFDTASGYKKSEKKIGEFIKKEKTRINIITKFTYPKILEIKNSLKRLNLTKLHAVLIHNPQFIFNKSFDHKIVNHYLMNIKKNCKYIGVSFNFPSEFIKFKKIRMIKFYQIPFNILDGRWNDILLKKKRDEKIYARSIFLQGLLVSDNINVCPKNIRPEFKKVRAKLLYIVKKLDRFDIKDLLIAYVNYFKKIDKIVIGIDNMDQLRQLPFYFLRKQLTKKDMNFIEQKIPKIRSNLITPQNWNVC